MREKSVKMKRITALIASFAMLVSLSACALPEGKTITSSEQQFKDACSMADITDYIQASAPTIAFSFPDGVLSTGAGTAFQPASALYANMTAYNSGSGDRLLFITISDNTGRSLFESAAKYDYGKDVDYKYKPLALYNVDCIKVTQKSTNKVTGYYFFGSNFIINVTPVGDTGQPSDITKEVLGNMGFET
jgi:hypothetical protein